jgi:ElaB/YqjD/DUF883 family membrane-anchored ribosome-binding protein
MTQRSTSSGDQFSVSGSTGSTTNPSTTQPLNTLGTGQQSSTTQQVTDQARQIASQAGDQAGQLADQARTQVTSQISSQKERAATSLHSVAEALRQTGQQLRDQDQSGVTQYVDRAADQVERLSTYLQNNEVGDIINGVERFARQQPALFVSGAFTLGLLAARFLKSSNPQSGSYGYNQRDQYRTRMYGTTGYNQGFQGTTGYNQGFQGTTGYNQGTTGYNQGFQGTTGYNQGTTGYSQGTTGYEGTTGMSGTYGGTRDTGLSSGSSFDRSTGTMGTGLVGADTSDTGLGSSSGLGSTGTSGTGLGSSSGLGGTSSSLNKGTSNSSTSDFGEGSRERGGREGL